MPGDFAEDIQAIQHFLQIHQPDIPRIAACSPVLGVHHRFQRHGGGAMPSAGVEINKINFLHYCFIPVSYGCHARRLKR